MISFKGKPCLFAVATSIGTEESSWVVACTACGLERKGRYFHSGERAGRLLTPEETAAGVYNFARRVSAGCDRPAGEAVVMQVVEVQAATTSPSCVTCGHSHLRDVPTVEAGTRMVTLAFQQFPRCAVCECTGTEHLFAADQIVTDGE